MPKPVVLMIDEPAALGARKQELGMGHVADDEVVCAASLEVGLRRLDQLRGGG